MIRQCLILVVLVLLSFRPAGAMHASVEVYQFQDSDKSYVEIFFYILGSSVKSGDELPSSVQIQYMIMQSEGGETVEAGDKYNLVVAAGSERSDFMDLRRHHLSYGTYTLVVEIRDNHDPDDVFTMSRGLIINSGHDNTSFSDLQLLSVVSDAGMENDKWTKNNIKCVPLPFGYCSDLYDQLNVYAELYHVDNEIDKDFYIKYTIAPIRTPENCLLTSHKRMSPKAVIPLLQGIDISGLSSGQYILSLGAYNQTHVLLAENKVLFSRSNPDVDSALVENFDTYFENSFAQKIDKDSMDFVLKAHAAKVSPIKMGALNFLIKEGEIEEQRRFIHRFWLESDPSDPSGAFRSHMQVANVVDNMFKSGFGYGFESDRGNIFMKYGAPNDVVSVEDEPSAPPYEIWIYYNFPVTGQHDVKFLFYSPELANSYDLLHSTCENEVNNRAWEQILYRNALTESRSGGLIDAASVAPNFNRRAKEYFTDF